MKKDKISQVGNDGIIAMPMELRLEKPMHNICKFSNGSARGIAIIQRARPGPALPDIELMQEKDWKKVGGSLYNTTPVQCSSLTPHTEGSYRDRSKPTGREGYVGMPLNDKDTVSFIEPT